MRFILLAPSAKEVEDRLRAQGVESDEEIRKEIEMLNERNRRTETVALDDVKVIDKDDLEQVCLELEDYIFGRVPEEAMEAIPDVLDPEGRKESNWEVDEDTIVVDIGGAATANYEATAKVDN